MAVKELLTWNADQKRWFKKYRGKMHAISCKALGTAATKEASRQAANQWWETRLKQLEAEAGPIDDPRFEMAIGTVEKMAAFWRSQGEQQLAHRLIEDANRIKRKIRGGEELTPLEADPLNSGFVLESDKAIWKDRFRQMQRQCKRTDKQRTIQAQVKSFIAHKETQALAGVLSVGRWGALKSHLPHFVAWIGGETSIDEIDSKTLKGFYHYLLGKKEWSKVYKASVFVSVKSFIRSLGEDDLISLPGKLNSKDFRFGSGAKKVQCFDTKELRDLLDEATEQTKLYILLMMNCGMYQSDISDLRHDEVDWKRGRIKRKRSKTEAYDECPEVDYPLWPETFTLLKKFRSADPVRVLVTAKGKPLKQEEIISGALSKTDNIQSAYRRLQENCEVAASKRKPLKLVRKTSATLLESHRDHGRYVSHFLGHSPRSVAEKHYAATNGPLFDGAITWLGKQYGLV